MNIENFTGKAEAYAKGRPGYPKAAIDYIYSLVPQNAIFADIGAGTGIFTVLLAERGNHVFAVEPNADMRGQLVISLTPFPNVKIIDGTDKATTLLEHSIDVITVAHALHWFDLNAFRAECCRIVKPGGLVIVIYNLSHGGEMMSLSKQVTDAFFTNAAVMEFPNPVNFTRDKWLAYIASQDDIPLPSDPGYDTHIAAVNAVFDRDCENGLLRNDRVVKVYSEKIK